MSFCVFCHRVCERAQHALHTDAHTTGTMCLSLWVHVIPNELIKPQQAKDDCEHYVHFVFL